ncbi:hypothetical protein NL676_019755 [Syzygium grande]|nr:hypothetical protein NL676_019755 [Syzygium grande]
MIKEGSRVKGESVLTIKMASRGKAMSNGKSNQLVKNGKSVQERRVFDQGEPGGAMAKDIVDDVTSAARRATLPEIVEKRKLKEMSQHH